MSLQKTSVPELLTLAGAVIAEPELWPLVVVPDDDEDFEPPPQPARTSANASTTRRDREEARSFMRGPFWAQAAAVDLVRHRYTCCYDGVSAETRSGKYGGDSRNPMRGGRSDQPRTIVKAAPIPWVGTKPS
jgi:hypothetical protein